MDFADRFFIMYCNHVSYQLVGCIDHNCMHSCSLQVCGRTQAWRKHLHTGVVICFNLINNVKSNSKPIQQTFTCLKSTTKILKKCGACSKLTIKLTSKASIWCHYCYFWTYFTPFFSTPIFDLEKENAC